MRDILAKLLDKRPYLIADGATGTSLFDRGLEIGGSPESWNVDHPDRIADLHQSFIDAGADIILTNTFGGSRYRLKLHKTEDRVVELNQAAAHIARSVADRAGHDIVVAGDIGPTGELFEPLGALTMETGTEAFAEQARALAAGGADVLWIETMSSREEVEAAVAGAASAGLPVVCTMTFDTAGRTMMGITPEDAASFCHGLLPSPAAFGANCGNGPAELIAALVGLARVADPGDVLVAKGNCGVPEYVDGKICYSGTPEVMASYARMARDSGARIIGACCGSHATHLRAIVEALDGYEPNGVPDTARIESELGPISFASLGNGADRRAPRRRRRRGG